MDLATGAQTAPTVHGREPIATAWFTDLVHGHPFGLLATNQLLYVANGGGGALLGVPVSAGNLKPLGNPIQLASDVRASSAGILSQYDAAGGLLVYASDPSSGLTHFVRRHTDGRLNSLALPAAEYGAFGLTAPGSRRCSGRPRAGWNSGFPTSPASRASASATPRISYHGPSTGVGWTTTSRRPPARVDDAEDAPRRLGQVGHARARGVAGGSLGSPHVAKHPWRVRRHESGVHARWP